MIVYIESYLLIDFYYNFRITFLLEINHAYLKNRS